MNGERIPDLISHLVREYGVRTPPADQNVAGFTDFCRTYLDANRPVENWPADSNVGLRLSNNVRVLVSPATDSGVAGSVQDAGAVGVSTGRSQHGQEGVVQVNDQQKVV